MLEFSSTVLPALPLYHISCCLHNRNIYQGFFHTSGKETIRAWNLSHPDTQFSLTMAPTSAGHLVTVSIFNSVVLLTTYMCVCFVNVCINITNRMSKYQCLMKKQQRHNNPLSRTIRISQFQKETFTHALPILIGIIQCL